MADADVIAAKVAADPTNPTLRARLAAAYLRDGRYVEASEQLDACLAVCPPKSRKRLLVAVLRVRLNHAARRWKLR